MEEEGIVLNLHGEVPSDAASGVTCMNAEEKFLPVLKELAGKYPRLKIVLEHCTTKKAVETVRGLGENVAGTIVGAPDHGFGWGSEREMGADGKTDRASSFVVGG